MKCKKNCRYCGECGHFMHYKGINEDDGDCASIKMNKECNDGKNPFNEEYGVLLQVGAYESACLLFRKTRTPRVRKYINEHSDLYDNSRILP